MRVLFDTNVILDVLFRREPFVTTAAALWQANEDKLFEGYVAGITPVNLFYIAAKIKGASAARAAVRELLEAFRVCPIDATILQSALTLPLLPPVRWMRLSLATQGIMPARPSPS